MIPEAFDELPPPPPTLPRPAPPSLVSALPKPPPPPSAPKSAAEFSAIPTERRNAPSTAAAVQATFPDSPLPPPPESSLHPAMPRTPSKQPLVPEDGPLVKRKAPAPPPQLNSLQFSPTAWFTYAPKAVPWSLQLRKEVFSPSEILDNPVAIELIFKQVSNVSLRLHFFFFS